MQKPTFFEQKTKPGKKSTPSHMCNNRCLLSVRYAYGTCSLCVNHHKINFNRYLVSNLVCFYGVATSQITPRNYAYLRVKYR
jgi:hypothetical protein